MVAKILMKLLAKKLRDNGRSRRRCLLSSWLLPLACGAVMGFVVASSSSMTGWSSSSSLLLSQRPSSLYYGRRSLAHEEESSGEVEGGGGGAHAPAAEVAGEHILHEGSEDEEEEEEEGLGNTVVAVVVCIILVLILLTLAFETLKDMLEEYAEEDEHDLEPVLEKLFGELTVLGFLSMVTFIVSKTGIIVTWSERIFGEEEELLEYLETVHFCIFFIMLFFVMQTIILFNTSISVVKKWMDMEESCRTGEDATGNRDLTLYKALRNEFILERSTNPPFAPAHPAKRVDDDFHFGRYLSHSLHKLLARIVEIGRATWTLFILGMLIFYLLVWAVDYDMLYLAWIWVAIGLAQFVFNRFVFEPHLIKLSRSMVPASALTGMNLVPNNTAEESSSKNETSGLLDRPKEDDLPPWCYMEHKQSWVTRCFFPGHMSRFQTIYWMDRHGTEVYITILQANFLFAGLYILMLGLGFAKEVYRQSSTAVFALYILLALLPLAGMAIKRRMRASLVALCCSFGTYRKPQIVTEVMREEKTIRLVRTFIVMYRMRHLATHQHKPTQQGKKTTSTEASTTSSQTKKKTRPPAKLTGSAALKAFEAIDVDASGELTVQECGDFVAKLGASISTEMIKSMISKMDKDGDGRISREEFMQWYSACNDMNDLTTSRHEQAKEFFLMFDEDNSGEITIEEFKYKLDDLDMGFTLDEIGLIVNELDHGRNGMVSFHEFEHLLKKFYPRELVANDNNSSNNGATAHQH